MGRAERRPLTAAEIKTLKEPGLHWVDDGLYLQIKGGRSWVHRYMFGGKPRMSGLGSADEVTLAQAREKRDDEVVLYIRKGLDPVAERRRLRDAGKVETRTRKTFREVATRWIADNESSWRNPVHRAQWPSTMAAYVYPVIGDMFVDDITTDQICDILRPIWTEKPETARRVRARIERILGAAKAQGLRTGENPARLADNIALVLPRRRKTKKEVRHHPALPWEHIPTFMARLREHKGIAARALEFVILTAVRTGDIIGQDYEERPPMKWPDVNFDERLWIIPATKNDSEHRVPLSAAAIAVLQGMKNLGVDAEIVFPSIDRRGQALSNNAMLVLLERMGRGDITVHGFRSTFRDWVGHCTNFPRELAEKAIEHTVGDETERAYQRGDLLEKRRKLMEAWAGYCSRPAEGNVTPLRKSA